MAADGGLLTRGSPSAAFPAGGQWRRGGGHLPSQRRDRPGLAPGSLSVRRLSGRDYHRPHGPEESRLRVAARGGWAALIFAISAIPSLGTGLGTWDLVLRKLAHVTEYAVLGFLLARVVAAPPAFSLACSTPSPTSSTRASSRGGTARRATSLIDAARVAIGHRSSTGARRGEGGRDRRRRRARRHAAALARVARGRAAPGPRGDPRRTPPRSCSTSAWELARAARALRRGSRAGALPAQRRGRRGAAASAGGRRRPGRVHRVAGAAGARRARPAGRGAADRGLRGRPGRAAAATRAARRRSARRPDARRAAACDRSGARPPRCRSPRSRGRRCARARARPRSAAAALTSSRRKLSHWRGPSTRVDARAGHVERRRRGSSRSTTSVRSVP